MNSPMIQLLVLAAIAVFLILRLKNVLGTRTGFEKPAEVSEKPERQLCEQSKPLDPSVFESPDVFQPKTC